jgi:hypothetical protein
MEGQAVSAPESQSPFPGMDPYLEDPALWPEFHRYLVAELHRNVTYVAPTYRAVVDTRRYSQHEEPFIEIRRHDDNGLVTLLDVVSPANKTAAAPREAFLEQRRAAKAEANVVEIDLVLQGNPMLQYSREGLPDWDYAVTVSRQTHPDRFEIYTATLQKRLPRFRLPLNPDRDSVLDLGEVFRRSFSAGDFRSRIDYRKDPPGPLSEENGRWLDDLLISQGLREHFSHEEVAAVAYSIWQQEGCPHGRDKEHWWKALAQLRVRGGP